jgi:cytochrome c biogenesis protein CcmG/thiol:disulfide interchange protein DsbE
MQWRKHLTIWNLLMVLLLIWAAPRLLPHLGALIGIRSGGSITPAWSVMTLDGAHLTSDSLRGQVVLVNFWATWCFPCRAEMPLLEAMHTRHRDAGFTLMGFSVDREGPDVVRRFVDERSISYPIAIVGGGEERAFGGIRGYPTSFLIDRKGTVRHAVIGPLAPATLELAVRRLLDEPRP